MRLFLLSLIFLSTAALSEVEIVSERARLVMVTHQECEMKEVFVDNSLGNSLLGGIIGGLLGKQIGNGSGKDIATVLGAIAGTNVGRTRSSGRMQRREVCHDVMEEVQKGKYVTVRIEGSLHTILVD